MVKVFFADAGSIDQLTATLTTVEDARRERLAESAEVCQHPAGAFPHRCT